MKKLDTYKNEAERNRKKFSRRAAALNDIAKAHGWSSWSEYETSVKNKIVTIAQKPE